MVGNVDPLTTESRPSPLIESTQGAEHGITVRHFLQVIRQRFWVAALSAILITGMVVGYSFAQTPVYEASIKILIGQQRAEETPPGALGSAATGLQQITKSMTETLDTRPVAEGVIQELDLHESPDGLLGNLTARQVGNTQVIQVTYSDTSPEEAQRIVDAVGDEFSTQVSDLSQSTLPVSATVWERAVTPHAPASPDPLRNGLLAFVIGGMLGVGLAFLLAYLDTSLRSQGDVEQTFGIPAFGVIPRFKRPKAKKESD
jgi:capsular polysaccharide biosynthesis protein